MSQPGDPARGLDSAQETAAAPREELRPPSVAVRFTPGTLLANRYRIVAPLGKGGMGEVYRADDIRLGQPVALKFLPAAFATDVVRLERLVDEVRIGRQISHPNVCRLYDIAETEGQHFLVMEYVDGEDLASLLRRIGRLPSDKSLEIARDLCAGLVAAHDRGVVHRDLKPANVMIDGHGHARIADFGLAALATSGATTGLAGTPAYMAPEQLAGEGASLRSDVYALGLVLYEMFTGQRAFDAKSLDELRALHATARPLRLSSSAKDVDPAVERLVLRCLERDPKERPANARVVLASLPGGDPLQAAVLAGETPSPEMVAAAALVGDLSARAAWTWLATASVALGAVLWLSERVMLHRLVPLPKSPDVLIDRAKTIAERLAHDDRPVDHAWGFEVDWSYLRGLTATSRSAVWTLRRADLEAAATQRPGPLRFWYRESPEPLVARSWTPRPPWVPGGRHVGRVTLEQPPQVLPLMHEVLLDPSGRLLRWSRVSASNDGREPDLDATLALLFSEAGLEQAKFTRDPSPQTEPEQRLRWRGVFPTGPGPVRVEATVRSGRLATFEVSRGDVVEDPWLTTLGRRVSRLTRGAAVRMVAFLAVPAWLGIFALIVRNWRLRRGDARGAFRLVLFGAVTGGAALKLGTHFTQAWYAEDFLDLWLASDAQAIFWAVVGGIWYFALEPEVRRTWPHTLISWSRLLAGRWRDPLVGRDALLGATAGLLLTCLAIGGDLLWGSGAGLPLRVRAAAIAVLGSNGEALSTILWWLYPSVCVAIGGLLSLLLLFKLTRNVRVARVLLFFLFYFLVVAGVEDPRHGWFGPLASLLGVILISRLGLLSTALAIYFTPVLLLLPLTTDWTAWYAGSSALGLGVVIAILAYGFFVSLAGKPLFGRRVLEG